MSRLPTELPGLVTIRLVPHTDAEAEAAVRTNDWSSHGAIVRRGSKVIYRAADHRVAALDMHRAVLAELDLPPWCQPFTQ